MRSNLNRISHSFEDEEEGGLDAASESDSSAEPDYAFDGYSVEFLEKVALMPVVRATVIRSVES